MKKIYLIVGETGEYDDYTSWNVKAFTDQTIAKDFLEEAYKWLLRNKIWMGHKCGMTLEDTFKIIDCPFDSNFKCDYTGTNYRIEEIELDKTKYKGINLCL